MLFALAAGAACRSDRAPASNEPEPPAAASYTGASACAECHADETAAWRGSDHALAMQEATSATVLGSFDGTRVDLPEA